MSESQSTEEPKPVFQLKEKILAKKVPKLQLHQFQPLFQKLFASFALQIEQKFIKIINGIYIPPT